jgi:hypothetical protein
MTSRFDRFANWPSGDAMVPAGIAVPAMAEKR